MALITSGVYELELIEFLRVESLARLDSALTNKALRPELLEWLRKVPIPQTMEWARVKNSPHALKWLLLKHCKLPAIIDIGFPEGHHRILEDKMYGLCPSYTYEHTGPSNKDVHTMVEQNRNRIRVLNVAGLDLTDACLSHIAECLSESLEAINIFDCTNVSTSGIHALFESFQRLKALEVNVCMFYYNFNAYASDFEALATAEYFHKLEFLRLGWHSVDNKVLEIIGSACPSLRHIVLTFFNDYISTHEGLVALAKGCPLLETIQVDVDHINANGIDAVMNALATHCPQLRTLSIRDYKGSNAAAANLFEKCKNLQHVMFGDCPHLGDAVRSLAAVKGLKMLEIGACPLVSDADVRLVVDSQIASLISVEVGSFADYRYELKDYCMQTIPKFDDGPYDPVAFDRIYNARLSRAGKRFFYSPAAVLPHHHAIMIRRCRGRGAASVDAKRRHAGGHHKRLLRARVAEELRAGVRRRKV